MARIRVQMARFQDLRPEARGRESVLLSLSRWRLSSFSSLIQFVVSPLSLRIYLVLLVPAFSLLNFHFLLRWPLLLPPLHSSFPFPLFLLLSVSHFPFLQFGSLWVSFSFLWPACCVRACACYLPSARSFFKECVVAGRASCRCTYRRRWLLARLLYAAAAVHGAVVIASIFQLLRRCLFASAVATAALLSCFSWRSRCSPDCYVFSLLLRRSGDSVTYAANSIMPGPRCSACYVCVCVLGCGVFLFSLL